LLERRHLALGDRGADLHARSQVPAALPFLLFADDLLDLGPQPAERLLEGRHLGHDRADPLLELGIAGLIDRSPLRHYR